MFKKTRFIYSVQLSCDLTEMNFSLSFKTDYKTSPKVGGFPNRSWTRYNQQDSIQPSPDYQHNVYIPGTPSTLCTLKLANNGDIEVYNSFSTFGKKKKPNNNLQEDAVITNDFFK